MGVGETDMSKFKIHLRNRSPNPNIGEPDAGESGLLPAPHPGSRFLHPLSVACCWLARVTRHPHPSPLPEGEGVGYEHPMLLPQLWQR
jgi:hypothetical protein